ncbi:MAG: cellulase family glycosylhydrolase [Melioribacteraceae bacterium]|nr:cellulase family glycosylhydrolase [Melioribacteraceae bacterium]
MKLVTSMVLILIITFSGIVSAQLTPQEAIGQMIRGINIGNTMENGMQGPIQEYYFDDYVKEGFQCIRIPVNWGDHTAGSSPYTINASWMNTVEKVVDWGLERGLFIIINGHHEDWLKQNYSAANKARYDSIWEQVATRFKDKSDRLLFEILNEPFGMTKAQVDDLNLRIIPIIRQTNPTRIIIYSGPEWCGVEHLTGAAVPQDSYVMGYFHSYDPWSFAGDGNGIFPTSEVNSTKSRFTTVANWSASKNIPAMLSEFGARTICDFNSRMIYYATNVESAVKNNVAFQAWDDAGYWGIYQRASRSWDRDVVDILTKTHPEGPTALKVTADSTAILTWQNRTSSNDRIEIQKRINNGNYNVVAELGINDTKYEDKNITPGSNIYYRVISVFDSTENYYSYPILTQIVPQATERAPYLGTEAVIPGTIEAEDYDIGGEGLSYHDTDPTNIPGDYRPLEGVDVQKRVSDGGYHLGYIENGEWVEYTVKVEKTANYNITIRTASEMAGGKFRFEIGSNYSTSPTVPSTGSWEAMTTLNATMSLTEGEYHLRLYFNTTQPFNIDQFTFTEDVASSLIKEVLEPDEYILHQNYPNPFNPSTSIEFGLPQEASVSLVIYNALGEHIRTLVRTGLNAGYHRYEWDGKGASGENLPSGIYIYRLFADGGKESFSQIRKMILIK